MSKKNKKKLTPKQLKEKENRKAKRESTRKQNRLLSLIVTAIGAVTAYFLLGEYDTVTRTALCVLAGFVCGVIADIIIAMYYKSKENRTK